MSFITVCTPTYNRAHTLSRPFKSLMKQSFRDFEWLIIDDGSTDNTSELVEGFKQEADFPINYIKTENRGRAAALNESYRHISTEYVMNLDSDDELTDDALQKMHDIWCSMSDADKKRFWCISGQCVDNMTGSIVGGIWPDGINKYTGKKQRKMVLKYKRRENACCRRFDVVKKYLFPSYPETKFVTEAVVWDKIGSKYDQYCTNEVFRIYYTDSQDSLVRGNKSNMSQKYTYYYLSLFYLNELYREFFCNKNVRMAILNISRLAIVTKRSYKKVMKELNRIDKRILVSLGWPVMWIFTKVYYK